MWLLAAEMHDDRHKGRADAYDRFAGLEARGVLFPQPIDYKWLELDRRRLDVETFADDVRRDAQAFVTEVVETNRASGHLAGVPVAGMSEERGNFVVLSVVVSAEPIRGERSGYEFPLTDDRFHLFAEAVRKAAEDRFGPEVLVDELFSLPEPLRGAVQYEARGFVLVFEERTQRSARA